MNHRRITQTTLFNGTPCIGYKRLAVGDTFRFAYYGGSEVYIRTQHGFVSLLTGQQTECWHENHAEYGNRVTPINIHINVSPTPLPAVDRDGNEVAPR